MSDGKTQSCDRIQGEADELILTSMSMSMSTDSESGDHNQQQGEEEPMLEDDNQQGKDPMPDVPVSDAESESGPSRVDVEEETEEDTEEEKEKDDTMLTITPTNTGKLYFVGLSSLDFKRASKRIRASCIYNGSSGGVIVPPCSDYVLISNFGEEDVWALYNISTGKSHKLPKHDESAGFYSQGIGYDRFARDYKVVRLAAHRYPVKSFIYSVSSKQWREILNQFPGRLPPGSGPGVFFRGALLWTGYSVVIALDLSKETYSMFPLPSGTSKIHGNQTYSVDGYNMYLDVWDLRLFLSCYTWPAELNKEQIPSFGVYMLHDSGRVKSWLKLHSLSFPPTQLSSPFPWNLRAIAYMKTKQKIVILDNRKETQRLLWFDVVNKNCTNIVEVIKSDTEAFDFHALPARRVKRLDETLELRLTRTFND